MNLREKTATQLSEMLNAKEISSVELTTSLINETEAENKEINGFIKIDKDFALAEAKKADELIAEGKATPLTGVPIGIKDNINLKGQVTSCGSKMLANYTSPYTATVAERMQNAGMVIMGKTNMDEFAMGTTGESSFYGATKNIWNKNYTTGGSSSGSAAVLAAMQVPLALGSDTGGSVRLPASYCGVVGYKPTYGTISRAGVVPVASSLDQIGPMARSVNDIKLLYDVINGHDKMDATTFDKAKLKTSGIKSLAGVKIGVPKQNSNSAAEISKSVESGINVLKANGAELIELDSKTFQHALSAYYIISSAEISSNMGRFDGSRYGFRAENYKNNYEDMFIQTRSQGFSAEIQKRIMLGTFFLTTEQYHVYYTKAVAVKEQIKAELTDWFSKCDVVIMPTAPNPVFEVGKGKNISEAFKEDEFTALVNLAGIPAISVPCGFDSNNMPVGMQIMGNHFADNTVLDIADLYEQAVGGFPTYKSVGGDR